MNQTIEDGVGDGGVLDLAMPVGDGELGGDDRRAAAEAVVEDLEEIACPGGIDGGQGPVVDDDEVDAGEVAVEPGDGALAVGDAQVVEQPWPPQVEGLVAFETGLVGERTSDPTLAGAGRTSDILMRITAN